MECGSSWFFTPRRDHRQHRVLPHVGFWKPDPGKADVPDRLRVLPAGSSGSYTLSHAGDAYLGLRSLNGDGISGAPAVQQQVGAEDTPLDLNAPPLWYLLTVSSPRSSPEPIYPVNVSAVFPVGVVYLWFTSVTNPASC